MHTAILKLSLGFVAAVALAITPAALSGEAPAQGYEIKNADRGPVHRVKVFYDGRMIENIFLSRGRKQASSYCCTPEGCKELAPQASCSTFKMTCDTDGACWASSPRGQSSAALWSRRRGV